MGGPTSFTPPENGASAFSGRNKCQNFPGKTGFPRGAALKIAPNPNTTHPVAKFQNRKPKFTLCIKGKRASYALNPRLPQPWVHSPSGPRFWTLTWSGLEFPTPLNPMQKPPPRLFLATNPFRLPIELRLSLYVPRPSSHFRSFRLFELPT